MRRFGIFSALVCALFAAWVFIGLFVATLGAAAFFRLVFAACFFGGVWMLAGLILERGRHSR